MVRPSVAFLLACLLLPVTVHAQDGLAEVPDLEPFAAVKRPAGAQGPAMNLPGSNLEKIFADSRFNAEAHDSEAQKLRKQRVRAAATLVDARLAQGHIQQADTETIADGFKRLLDAYLAIEEVEAQRFQIYQDILHSLNEYSRSVYGQVVLGARAVHDFERIQYLAFELAIRILESDDRGAELHLFPFAAPSHLGDSPRQPSEKLEIQPSSFPLVLTPNDKVEGLPAIFEASEIAVDADVERLKKLRYNAAVREVAMLQMRATHIGDRTSMRALVNAVDRWFDASLAIATSLEDRIELTEQYLRYCKLKLFEAKGQASFGARHDDVVGLAQYKLYDTAQKLDSLLENGAKPSQLSMVDIFEDTASSDDGKAEILTTYPQLLRWLEMPDPSESNFSHCLKIAQYNTAVTMTAAGLEHTLQNGNAIDAAIANIELLVQAAWNIENKTAERKKLIDEAITMAKKLHEIANTRREVGVGAIDETALATVILCNLELRRIELIERND